MINPIRILDRIFVGCFLALGGAWWGGLGYQVDAALIVIAIAAGVLRTVLAYRNLTRRGL